MGRYVRNTWYPVAWSRDIGRTLARRTVIEEDVVLYRTEGGNVAALEDACPHKLAPLSIGRLEGDQVECGYHGLTFDASGRCTRVPGMAHAVAESMGMV